MAQNGQTGPQDSSSMDHFLPFLDLWDPLVGPPGVLMLVYHFQLLPPLKISVKIMKICFLGEFDGSKIKIIKDFGQL